MYSCSSSIDKDYHIDTKIGKSQRLQVKGMVTKLSNYLFDIFMFHLMTKKGGCVSLVKRLIREMICHEEEEISIRN